MDEELKRLLDELREQIGQGNTDLAERIDAIETAAGAREADVSALREQIETIQQAATEREATIAEMQRRSRVERIEREGIATEREAQEVLGVLCARSLAAHRGVSLPRHYQAAVQRAEQFNERVRASLETDSGSGANVVPTLLSSQVFDTVEEVSSLLNFCDFQPNLPGKMDLPTLTSRPSLQHKRTNVSTEMSEGSIGISQVSFDPDEMYIFIPVDNRLLEMSAVNLGALVMRLIREGAVEGLVNDLLNADGTSAYNSITGFLNESTAAYLYIMSSDLTAFGDVTFDELWQIKSKALKRARARGRWVMSNDVLGLIANLDRTGKVPAVTYGRQGNVQVLMSPVEIDEGMPELTDSTAATAFIGFGDLSEYLVGLTTDMRIDVSSEYRFGYNQTCWRLVLNGDIKRKGSAGFITGKTASM
jgi:HK97 family phage major capsid protein